MVKKKCGYMVTGKGLAGATFKKTLKEAKKEQKRQNRMKGRKKSEIVPIYNKNICK